MQSKQVFSGVKETLQNVSARHEEKPCDSNLAMLLTALMSKMEEDKRKMEKGQQKMEKDC